MIKPYQTLTELRPWGKFQQFCHNEPVTVKIITVRPWQKLSLQRHNLRDELWIILDEGLLVTVNNDTHITYTSEEVWIPRGSTHRVENRNYQASRFLEVAFGHFDENDIERLEDVYGRT